jgi:hypothetical protein
VRHAKTGDSLELEISRDRAATHVTVKVEKRRGYDYEFDLGDLGRHLGRDLGRDLGRHAWALRDGPIVFRDRRALRDRPENLDRLHEKLEEMENRLRDLEKKLSSR